MSTIDGLETVNSSYRNIYDGKVGFDMTPIMQSNNGIVSVNGDIFPYNGPLLFVVTNNLRLDTDLTIRFKYKTAVFKEYKSQFIYNREIKIPTYEKDDTVYEGEVVIPKSSQFYFEKIYNKTESNVKHVFDARGVDLYQKTNETPDHIYEITEVTYVDPVETNWIAYVLSSNGARIVNGFSFNYFRERMDNIIRSFFTSPRICPLCEGVGKYPATKSGVKINQYGQLVDEYEGETCPSCKGDGYIGWNANEDMIKFKAYDVSISESYVSTIESLQDYAWATRHWLVPSERDIKGFISRIAKVTTDKIHITQYGILGGYSSDRMIDNREPYFYITIDESVPEETVKIINDVLFYKLPVGYSVKIYSTDYFTPQSFPLNEANEFWYDYITDAVEIADRSPDIFNQAQFGTEDDMTTYKSDGNLTAIKYDETNRATVSIYDSTGVITNGVYQDGDANYTTVLNFTSGSFFNGFDIDLYIKTMIYDNFWEA